MCVPFEGYDYTQADGIFELPDGMARVYINGGTCAEVSTEETGEEEPGDDGVDADGVEDNEILFLLPSSRASVLYPVLADAGYTTARSVLDADVDDLVALHGIGEKTAEALQNAAYAFINEE